MGLSTYRRLAVTLGLTLLILAAEAVGGFLSNSLALLSDAGHIITDAFAIGLSIIAARISQKAPDERATYGYHRVSLLAALINGVSLVAIAALIFIESYTRFITPPTIDVPLMLAIAALGLLGNVAMVIVLGRGHGDLNIKSVWLHIMGDTLSSVGVVISGAIIYYTGWPYADPVASSIIGVIIVWGGVRLTREAASIFLDLTPRGFSVETLARRVSAVPGVIQIHDVHLRSLSHRRLAFSAHVWVRDQALSEAEEIRNKIQQILKEEGIGHATLQLEAGQCENDGFYCQIHGEVEHADHNH